MELQFFNETLKGIIIDEHNLYLQMYYTSLGVSNLTCYIEPNKGCRFYMNHSILFSQIDFNPYEVYNHLKKYVKTLLLREESLKSNLIFF